MRKEVTFILYGLRLTSNMSTPLSEAISRGNVVVFFDISIAGVSAGRISMELFTFRWSDPFLRSTLEVLLRRLEMKPHGIAAGLHFAIVPDDPHGFVVEPGIGRPIVRDKV